ncbi:MAG: hypothetical protein IJX97_03600 [Clostridia bacterium]|nr:hypothetical protein [Clostridia bacterium]
MSRQHFYSRVPARVSLYNKRDGFDTFAMSEGLSKEFVLGELSTLYANKLNIHDPVRVRRGEIPTVYSRMGLSDGRLAQTAIRYLPTDFTGERSAYIAHTLILDGAERDAVLLTDQNDAVNPDMFMTDISKFNITARDASPIANLADKAYLPQALTDPKSVISRYDPEMMKGFIFAVLDSLCEGARPVYFRLPVDDAAASREALAIFNAVSSVIPPELRGELSFVSFVSNPEAYQGFKLKCVSSACDAVPKDLGAFFDFKENTVSAQPESYRRNATVAAFLYSLAENKRVREDFHAFTSAILSKCNLTLKNTKDFGEIVFVFWQCSGLYVESSILPTDDNVARFLELYQKYREGIAPNHRKQAYRCLARYSDMQVALPDNIFDKLGELYTDECVQARAVALDVLLNLIHVDVMREKLFAFINKYYDSEIDRVKAVINSNLSRVFYGGFLQHTILSFFDLHWSGEPVSTRDIILDKLLLSIRTPEIQRDIVIFLDKHYEGMTAAQKMKIVDHVLEMLPECDFLTVLLTGLINRRIGAAGDDLSALMANKLREMLDRSVAASDPRLAAILMDEAGFACDVAVSHVLGGKVGEKMLIDILAAMSAHKRVDKLARIPSLMPKMKGEEYRELICSLKGEKVNILPSTVYEIMAADAAASATLGESDLELLREVVIYPAIKATALDVFKVKYGKEGVDALVRYAKGRENKLASENYAIVTEYVKMTSLCAKGDTEGVFRIAAALPEDRELHSDIADHILMCTLNTSSQSATTACTYELLINYLKTGNFRFDAIYSKYRRHYERVREDESNVITAKLDPPDRRGAADAAELLLSCVSEICNASGELAELACGYASGLKRALAEFFGIYGIGARIFLKKHFEDGYDGVQDIFDELVDERNSEIKSFDDAVDLVLRRK